MALQESGLRAHCLFLKLHVLHFFKDFLFAVTMESLLINFSMLSSQASGVISGVQTVENGPIQWSRELPHSCLLSQGEKQSRKIVIPSHPIFVLWISFSHVASTRYQETSHANLSRSAWSQPSEDVDLWEVLQRGEADTLPIIVAKSHEHWDIRWPTCWGRRKSMCTTWTSWASCVSTSTDPK